MPGKRLETKVRHLPAASIIDLYGDIDGFSVDEMNEAYSESEKNKTPLLVLNFTDVDYINSTGIALIINMMISAQNSDRRMIAYGLSEHYQEIFNITQISRYIQVYSNESEAFEEIEKQETKKAR